MNISCVLLWLIWQTYEATPTKEFTLPQRGVWQAVVFGFGGIHLTENGPVANPKLPAGWTRLKFQFVWRGQVYEFDLKAPAETEVEVKDEGLRLKDKTSNAGELTSSTYLSSLIPHPSSVPSHSLKIQGVIFDLDGVLTDTSEFHYLAWKQLADEEGIPFDRTVNESLRGVSRRDSLLTMLNGRSVSEDQLQEMMARKNGYYLDLIRTITPDHLLPGVLELLNELRSAGIKIALGSASKNAEEVLERLGILSFMDAIADGHSVQNSKPAPDVFLHAASQLDLPPKNCVVVEDAAAGIEAALQAGMWTIGLGPNERVGAAHLVLPSLQGVQWQDLNDKLSFIAQAPVDESVLQQVAALQRSN